MGPSGRDDGPSDVMVSAHAAGFVRRAGGAIARCAEDGAPVTVLCLTYDERIAQAAGLPERSAPPLGGSQVMAFEPRRPERRGFVPNRFLDISPVSTTSESTDGMFGELLAVSMRSRGLIGGELGLDMYGLRAELLGVRYVDREEHTDDDRDGVVPEGALHG